MGKSGAHDEDYYLELATRGEHAGIEYLVNAFQSMSYTIAMKVVNNKEDAEEVVQDAFVKAFASLDSFRRASRFSTWLYRIVYNTALSKFNIRRNDVVRLDEQVVLQASPEPDNADRILENADRKKYLNLALAHLRPTDRLIVTLHYIAEKSIAETGKIMGLKRSAVKMRLLRARKELEIKLEILIADELNNFRRK